MAIRALLDKGFDVVAFNNNNSTEEDKGFLRNSQQQKKASADKPVEVSDNKGVYHPCDTCQGPFALRPVDAY